MKKLIIMLGKTGSGKDTQVDLLVKEFSVSVLRMGDLVRAAAKKDEALAADLEEGELAPNSVVDGYFDEFVSGNTKEIILSDGYPRHIEQAHHIAATLETAKLQIFSVLYIHISDAEVYRRLKLRKRADDELKAITERLEEFESRTQLVVDYYKDLGKLIHINGEQSVDKVFTDIKEKLRQLGL